MDNRKFEKLIDLIINENQEQASALFHDIVVEKSREIYESIMDEEMMGQDGGMGGQVGGLLDEIDAEESGMNEEDDELDDLDDLEGSVDIDAGDLGDEEAVADDTVEDTLVRVEDKLDQLMAEFEEIMGGGADDGADDLDDGAEDFGAGEEEGAEDFDAGAEAGAEEEATDEVMEAVQLQSVKGLYGSKIGGDNGANAKSPVKFNSGQVGMGSKPVTFAGQANPVPTGPKGPSNYGNKGETQVKHAGSFKNSPGSKTQDGEAAAKPTKTQASGVNNKSPIAESKRLRK